MKRREFLHAASLGAALPTLAMSGIALAADHKGHDSSKVKPARIMAAELKKIIEAARECANKGEICLSRCTDALEAGDKEMASCQRGVMDMIPVVEAMAKVATNNSANKELLKSMAKACHDFCKSCEETCKPHSAHYPECKDCMEACSACAKACEAYLKA